MTKILDALRTPGAMLIALVLALVAQLEHTAQVFLQVVDANGIYAQAHAYAFAGAVEVAVLLFVLAGHQRISYGFALATFATNLSYYAMHGVPLLSVAGAPAWLMSLLLPAAIVGYSHTIADANPAEHASSPAMPTGKPRSAGSGKNKEMDVAPESAASSPVFAPVAPAAPDVADDALAAIAQQDARAAALQMASEGCSVAQIAAQVDAKPATVRSWIARDKAKRNGGTHA